MSVQTEVHPERLEAAGNSPEQPNPANRRAMIKKAGMLLGGATALAALGTPAAADTSEECGANVIEGLWAGVVSYPGIPSFNTIIRTDGKIWTDSGQTDLTPAALSSTLLERCEEDRTSAVPRCRTLLDLRSKCKPDWVRDGG
ncbi:MAG TPA: hypothetical protein VMT53_03315 [Terriglobales bacterium]|nr:hypothetical protein [Terriglobales bacterium]